MVFGALIALTALVATLQGFLDCGLFSLLLVQWLPLGSLAKPDPSAARECLIASLYRDLYQAAEILQSNQIAERAITKF